jgi:hypothetical protein
LRKEMTMALPGMKVAGVVRSVLMVGAPLMIVGLLPGKPKPITVTGCLQKGTSETEFILTTKRGKKYEVEGTSLGLAGHVGHTVTIRGNFDRRAEERAETKAQEQAEHKTGEAQHEEHLMGRIEATNLKMVKATCS